MPRPRRSPPPAVEVLRLGHRPQRDPRLTTHVALTARAFGASRLLLNPPDPDLEKRMRSVSERWGSRFEVVGCPDWKAAVRAFDGPVVHLTMYGRPLDGVAKALDRSRRLLVVVGGAKVPPEIYRLARYNVAVGNQPHSEVAALAICLDRLVGPVPATHWKGGHQRIVPSARGKRIRKRAA